MYMRVCQSERPHGAASDRALGWGRRQPPHVYPFVLTSAFALRTSDFPALTRYSQFGLRPSTAPCRSARAALADRARLGLDHRHPVPHGRGSDSGPTPSASIAVIGGPLRPITPFPVTGLLFPVDQIPFSPPNSRTPAQSLPTYLPACLRGLYSPRDCARAAGL